MLYECISIQTLLAIFVNCETSKFLALKSAESLFIGSEENIEESSKHTLIKQRRRFYGDKVLAIRSNICEASILNCGYEKELCHFKVEKVHHFEFINPTFFKTTKDLLANATFSIIDVKSQDHPDWSIGAPTYIQAVVRSTMVESFSVYLDSDD